MDISFRPRWTAWILPVGTLIAGIPVAVSVYYLNLDSICFYYFILGIFGIGASVKIAALKKSWITIQKNQIMLPPKIEIDFPIANDIQEFSVDGLTIQNGIVTTFKYYDDYSLLVPLEDITAIWVKKGVDKKEFLFLATEICSFRLPLTYLDNDSLLATLRRVLPEDIFTSRAKKASTVNKWYETQYNQILEDHEGTYTINLPAGFRAAHYVVWGISSLILGLFLLFIPKILICFACSFIGGVFLIVSSYAPKQEIKINDHSIIVSNRRKKYSINWDEVENIIHDQEFYQFTGTNKILVIPGSIKDSKEKSNLSLLIYWIADSKDIQITQGQFKYLPYNKNSRIK